MVPLDGEEEGVGSFLGNICFQYPLGNLEASDDEMRRKKARRVKSKYFCIQETNMLKTEQGDDLGVALSLMN